jgi:hypothetical protein
MHAISLCQSQHLSISQSHCHLYYRHEYSHNTVHSKINFYQVLLQNVKVASLLCWVQAPYGKLITDFTTTVPLCEIPGNTAKIFPNEETPGNTAKIFPNEETPGNTAKIFPNEETPGNTAKIFPNEETPSNTAKIFPNEETPGNTVPWR